MPEIGPDYAEIFRETVKVNTLDYRQYERIQQTMIDALNEAVYMRVLGTNGQPDRHPGVPLSAARPVQRGHF